MARKTWTPSKIVSRFPRARATSCGNVTSSSSGSSQLQSSQPMTPSTRGQVALEMTPSPIAATPLLQPEVLASTSPEVCGKCLEEADPGSAYCLAGSNRWFCANCAQRVMGSDAAPQKTAEQPTSSIGAPPSLVYNSSSEMCSLCCVESGHGLAVRLTCSHGWYCMNCFQRYAEMRLEQGHIDITCPECRASLPEHMLRELLPETVMGRLVSQSLERAICSEGDLFSCPTPDCAMRVALDPGDVPQLKCPLCCKCSCLRCGAQPYHKGMSCEEHAQKASEASSIDSLLQWMKETGSKQCPACQMVVTKENLEKQSTQHVECHKMQCRGCNTKFCFRCLAVLSATYTCGCSLDAHGFFDPHTRKRVEHLHKSKSRRSRG